MAISAAQLPAVISLPTAPGFSRSALQKGIRRGELVLHYQPKVDLRTHQVVGVEALVRWQPPDGSLVFPDTFIPLAEEWGLMAELTASVPDQALDQYVVWRDAGSHLKVAVNVPASLLSDPRGLPHITEALARRAITPAAVTLEVTESVVMNDVEQSLLTLRRLREMGLTLSIDDFGTGYSSLSYLSRMPVGELKIDRSFVTGMVTQENHLAIVRSTVGLGHGFGFSVVAEGVEDLATYALLRRSGIDIAQGYFMSRPLAAARFSEWLSHQWPERAAALAVAVASDGDTAVLVPADDERWMHDARLRTYQRLVASRSAAAVAAALVEFVTAMGGTIDSDGSAAGEDLLPIDLSVGEGDPVLAVAPPGSRARRHLDNALPGLVSDARRMVHLLRSSGQR